MIDIFVNGKRQEIDAPSDMPLLWALRDFLGLTGTKYGCGTGVCGSCTVLMGSEAVRSCVVPLSAVNGAITTIEGLSERNDHPLQQAWLAEQVPQCGYCQSGQIMAAAALLIKTLRPDDSQINAAMSGNLCRCGTYPRIRAAIHRAAQFAALHPQQNSDPELPTDQSPVPTPGL
jgi:isoquinoline 1-oxidoreductase subunit alpha